MLTKETIIKHRNGFSMNGFPSSPKLTIHCENMITVKRLPISIDNLFELLT